MCADKVGLEQNMEVLLQQRGTIQSLIGTLAQMRIDIESLNRKALAAAAANCIINRRMGRVAANNLEKKSPAVIAPGLGTKAGIHQHPR